MYAILSHGGRQHRVSAGDRLVVDRLDARVGSLIALEPVLLTAGEGTTALGDDVDGVRVAVRVVRHLRGKKLRVFKYKPKKRSRKVSGHRSDLTEVRVESILARGDALPLSTSTPITAPPEAGDGAATEPVAGAVPRSEAVTEPEVAPVSEPEDGGSVPAGTAEIVTESGHGA